MRRQKEVILVAAGIIIAAVAFFASGLIPLPRVSQEQDSSYSPATTQVVTVPKTNMVLLYDGDWIFISGQPGANPWTNNTTIFKSE